MASCLCIRVVQITTPNFNGCPNLPGPHNDTYNGFDPPVHRADTLMLVYHCHKPVFTPKIAIFQRAGMREGGLPLPLAFQYLILMI